MGCSYWKDTNKLCFWFNYNNYHNNNVINTGYPIFREYNWDIRGYSLYPKTDISNIEKTYRVKAINPDSKLFFDPGSGFPRFKLGLTTNKRCIKTSKADFIVTSGSTEKDQSYNSTPYVIIETDDHVYILEESEFKLYFNSNLVAFSNAISRYEVLNNPKIVYTGLLYGYAKDSMYLGKYADGTYTLPYITDNDLDKIINNMCPEPTYDEILSIVDMLNSEDAATSQLGVKMLQAYNIDKYKLSLRLILCTRANWWLYSKTTVGAKQLVSSLNIDGYQIRDNFIYGSQYAYRKEETYTVEDVAIAKKLAKKFFTEYFQDEYNKLLQNNYPWLPDERKIKLE